MSRRLSARGAVIGIFAAFVLTTFSVVGMAQRAASPTTTPATAPSVTMPLRLNALAVRMVEPSGAGPVTITFQRWSTDAETQQVMDAIREAPKTLRDVISHLGTVGRIAGTGTVGNDIKFARMEQGTSGRIHITAASDRYIGFSEIAESPRSTEYPFTVFDITIDSNGTGSGTVSVATKISVDRVNKVLVFENFEDQPVKLQNVKIQK